MITRRDVLKGAAAAGVWAASRARLHAQSPAAVLPAAEPLVQYVDPFVGTGGAGRTFPGASMPGGLVQLSPDTTGRGRESGAGYHYTDSEIAGFSHTHLSGIAGADLCDILVMPTQAVTLTAYYVQNPGTSYGYLDVRLVDQAGQALPNATWSPDGLTWYVAGKCPLKASSYTLRFKAPLGRAAKVTVKTGGPASRNGDKLENGVLEGSSNGSSWTKLADFSDGVAVAQAAAETRHLRVRVTKPQENWLIIHEILVE